MASPDGFSRRSFLKHAGAAAALLAAPAIIPASALGRDGKVAPSNRIGLGLIGVGGRGKQHVDGFVWYKECQVLAICDVVEARRQGNCKAAESHYARNERAGAFKGVRDYNDFRDILARDDIDAVVISTPPHWHSVMTVMACEAGKDVYSEKPFSTCVRDNQAMVDAVRRYGRVFQHGTQWRTWPYMRRAAELLRAGKIGPISHVVTGGSFGEGHGDHPPQPVPAGLDWDLWLGPAPWRPYNGSFAVGSGSGEIGGGWLGDIGSHIFDYILWCKDMERTPPSEVIPPRGEEKRLQIKWADGFSIFVDPAGGPIAFFGSEGRRLEAFSRQPPMVTFPEAIASTRLGPRDVQLYPCKDFRWDFLNAVLTRQDPFCPVEVGANSASVYQLSAIAAALGRPLKWDGAKQTFINDEQANRRLDVPKRAPWHV